eukprot:7215498-Prymnesium_polylepis.1
MRADPADAMSRVLGVRHSKEKATARKLNRYKGEGAQVEHDEHDEQLPCAEPRVAVAAALHKWRAVAAGTAVGVAVGVGGKLPAGDDGRWT